MKLQIQFDCWSEAPEAATRRQSLQLGAASTTLQGRERMGMVLVEAPQLKDEHFYSDFRRSMSLLDCYYLLLGFPGLALT